MYYFKIKLSTDYNYYCVDYDNYLLYSQYTYADYYKININDLIYTNKFFTHIKEYSNKVDFYTENVFNYTLSNISYNEYLIQILISIIRDKKISKLLE